MIHPSDSDALAEMLRHYGTFGLTQELARLSQQASETDYKNNLEAVIHRDSKTLNHAVQLMALNHPLRSLLASR